MPINDYSHISKEYAKSGTEGTAYLAFRDVPKLIKTYVKGNNALDYGCGPGDSTRLLFNQGFHVEGVDVSNDMLKEAQSANINANFNLIQSGKLPFENNSFDLVFSSFVLFEISTKDELIKIFNEIYRVLKQGAVFIAVTGSEHLYNHKWVSLDVDFNTNHNLKSGDTAKVRLKDVDLIVYDYFWTHQDYLNVIQSSKLDLKEHLLPLGKSGEPYEWKDEISFPPYVIYILSKSLC